MTNDELIEYILKTAPSRAELTPEELADERIAFVVRLVNDVLVRWECPEELVEKLTTAVTKVCMFNEMTIAFQTGLDIRKFMSSHEIT